MPDHRTPSKRKNLVILISGNGSNMCAILQAVRQGAIHAEVNAVISDRTQADGLRRATEFGIKTIVLERRSFTTRAEYDTELCNQIETIGPDLIALAGFMHILSADFVACFYGKILNIHPSLLPKYKGLHTHQRVLKAGESQHGCSVHFVTEMPDEGPVILQAAVSVSNDDTAQTLATRVLKNEHIIYPKAIALYCDGRLKLHNGICLLDGQALTHPLLSVEDEQISTTT